MTVTFLALLACGGETQDTSTGSPTGLPAVCNPGASWAAGQQAFREATAEWGLDAIEPVGVRVGAVDWDGDGWTDLAVSSGTSRDDFAGTRSSWLLRNTGLGAFEDVTESSGFRATRDGGQGRAGPVVVWADVDNDGDLDAWTGLPDDTTGEDASEVVLNDGDGTFTLGPEGETDAGRDDNPYGAAFVDYDRDGKVDLWTGQYPDRQDVLWRANGGGKFNDTTQAAGLDTKPWSAVDDLNAGLADSVAWSAAACDLTNDGWPELLASSYGRAPNHLWQAVGDGTWVNRSVASGYAYDHRVDWSDNESARCWCKLHPTDEDCAGVPSPELIACSTDADAFRWDHAYDREPFRLGGNSGATVCTDVDNDGWFDLLTTEIVHWDVGSSSDPSELLFNRGGPDVAFDRPGNDVTGLTREHDRVDWNDGDITASVFDFDNDGWKDVWVGSSDYPGTRGLLWRQTSARSFAAVPPEVGIDHRRSHGSAVADFDRDGDLDLVVGHSSARCDADCYESFGVRLFENVVSDEGNFVQLQLVGGAGSNRAAIGARVDVTTAATTQSREVVGGYGQWGNQDDLVLHFGLGQDCEATVAVRWPDAEGTVESFNVGGGYRYRVTQGAGVEVIE